MSRIPSSIRAIQRLQVDVAEVLYLVREMARLHEEREPGEVGMESAVAILAEKYRDDLDRVHCIMERMRCLRRLLTDDRMKGWTTKGIEDGYLLTNEAIFRAVAKCRLRGNSRRMWFDSDEFFGIALSETEPEGTA
jgi:hypothetical protein